MRPTREGAVSPNRRSLVYKGIGIDPGTITTDPVPPTDRAALGSAFVPFLVTGAAALVQSDDVVGVGYVAVTLTLPNAPTVGNMLVISAGMINDGNPAFNLNNGTWILVAQVYSDSGTNHPNRMYYQPVTSSTTQSTTITPTGGSPKTGNVKAAILELSGVDTLDPDIEAVSNTATTSGTITPAAGLPAVLVSGVLARNNPGSVAPAGSMTELYEIAISNSRPQAVNYQQVTATAGAYTVGSTGASANSSVIGAAFVDTGTSIAWVDAPLTVDGDDATYDYAYDTGITEFWRIDLGDTYLISSMTARLGYETAGSNALILQGANESDYSDAVTVATIPVTATGSFTAQDVSDSWTPTAVYRYWQLVQTTEDDIRVFEVELFDPAEFTGAHETLTGRDTADQHPADAVSYDNGTSGLTATDVQAAIDEVVAAGGSGLTVEDEGTPLSTAATTLDFVGAGVVASGTGATKTITISGAAASAELDYVEKTSNTSITATTEATANTVVTGSAVAYDGSTVVMIEFFSQNFVTSTTSQLQVWLYDGSSSIGRIGAFQESAQVVGGTLLRRLTPSNATHTYSVRASTAAGTASVGGGPGGSGNSMPAFIRITRA